MRELTEDEVQAFERDGVVHVPGAVDAAWVPRMRRAVEALLDGQDLPAAQKGTGMDRLLYRDDPQFGRFVTGTGLARLAAQATRSSAVRIYFDQVFVKDPEVHREFPWHQDRPYWPIGGTQVASTWLALTPADVETSALEFVRGSHRWGRTYRPVGSRRALNAAWDGFGDLAETMTEEVVAFEDHPDRYDVVGFRVEPGDALLFDYQTLHRSRANTGPARRLAISWRWLGDDATWDWVHGNDPVIGPTDTSLQPGDPITDDDTFPVVHPAPA